MGRPVPGRPSIGALISNWREYEAPFATKVRLALRNHALRFVRRSTCCGHDGQPGC
jgi:hypothetical protein